MEWKVGDVVYVPPWTEDTRPDWAVSAMDDLCGQMYTVRKIENNGGIRVHGNHWWWKPDYLMPPFEDTEVDPATGIELAEFLEIG